MFHYWSRAEQRYPARAAVPDHDKKRRIASLPEQVKGAAVLYCTVLYCTVLYCTVLHCTVLYCTVPGQDDTDENGVGDECDLCRDDPDEDQEDSNHNNIGDVCDDGVDADQD